ncbi:sensor histidine kinase [Quadrisphaera sp. DSM 44207]|uniref:sensor histidine kinase n=1 Tax=Quadrisphaera sp. DSM 44207 TaxID=1881057 RepID=UPI0015A1CE25|nr:histidine kinase [Quadrisphaera sp. DSM 44207]
MVAGAQPSAGASGALPEAARRRWWRDWARGRDWARVRDVVVMVWFFLWAAFDLLGYAVDGDPGPSAWTWVEVALTVVLAAGLWWRRRHPFLLTLLACVVMALGGSSLLLCVTLFTLAIRHRDRLLLLAVAAALAVVAVGIVTDLATGGDQGMTILQLVFGALAFMVLVVVLPVALGAFVGARRDLVQSLRERAQKAETEQRLRAEQTRLAERTRIAREMHDVVGHRISLVALHAGGLEVNPAAGAQDVERSAALIRTTARQALEDLRAVLGVLRTDPVGAAETGLGAAGADLLPSPALGDVDRLVRASADAGVRVRLETDLPDGRTPPLLIGRTAYRVVQEGLTNVHKHAAGAAAVVRLTGAPEHGLVAEVCNARPVGALGKPLVPGSGLGLVGLRERVELVGGHLRAGRQPDGGFAVRAELPWAREQEGTSA